MGSSFVAAYREYLERVFLASDELAQVDQFTVPLDVDVTSPTLQEWCDLV